MSCVRFVRMMAELSGLPSDAALERAHEALFYVGWRGSISFAGYVFAWHETVGKACQAIVHGPRILFLDEPTNGLDPPARQRMIRLIREIRDSGRAHIVLSSHLLRDVEECCEEILVSKMGVLRFTATWRRSEERTEISGSGNKGRIKEAFSHAANKLGCECAFTTDRR